MLGTPQPPPLPASPQPCPRCPEVPVEALRRRRGVQGVAPLIQSHGTVGPAAAGCCPRGSGWVGGSCWGPLPHPHTPPIGPWTYRCGQAAGSRTSGWHGRHRGGKWAAWSGWCCWPAAAPTATATAPARPAGTRGGGGTQRVSPPRGARGHGSTPQHPQRGGTAGTASGSLMAEGSGLEMGGRWHCGGGDGSPVVPVWTGMVPQYTQDRQGWYPSDPSIDRAGIPMALI